VLESVNVVFPTPRLDSDEGYGIPVMPLNHLLFYQDLLSKLWG